MFKIITIVTLVYILYRISIKPAIPPAKEESQTRVNESKQKEKKKPIDKDDYIDYEEID